MIVILASLPVVVDNVWGTIKKLAPLVISIAVVPFAVAKLVLVRVIVYVTPLLALPHPQLGVDPVYFNVFVLYILFKVMLLTMPKFTSQILLLFSKVLHILEKLLLKNFTGLKVVS